MAIVGGILINVADEQQFKWHRKKVLKKLVDIN
jgi:hypothetical protein